MAAPPPRHPHPAILISDLVEEFLLRLQPEDPASLARAALVSKQWHRLITSPVFRRRFREFHRSPPLLGYIANLRNSIRFVPMSSFRPRHADLRGVRVVHSSHGHVLLQHRYTSTAWMDLDVLLSVWDPITSKVQDLPHLPLVDILGWDAAVICAVGDGDHGGCDGHFKVVFVGTSVVSNHPMKFSCLYSSDASGSWSDPIFDSGGGTVPFSTGSCVHIGSALYFMSAYNHEVIMYDLLTNQMSTISLIVGPKNKTWHRYVDNGLATVLIATEDGRLGVAKTSNSSEPNSSLRLCVREHGRWEERTLCTLLPPWVAGFAQTRAGVVFVRTHGGYFAVDIHSGRIKNVGECLGGHHIIPYVNFCSPAPGAVSTDEGPGANVLVPTDEGPGASLSSE